MSRASSSRGSSPPRLLPAILVVGTGLFLAVRGWTAVHTALRPTPPPTLTGGMVAVPAVQTALNADKALAAVELSGRDPLHRVYRPAPAQPVARPQPTEPEPLRPPVLRMLLVDRVNPVVQIYEDGELSPRLQAGDVFRGWTVVSIASGSVVVSKDGESFTLTLRRDQ